MRTVGLCLALLLLMTGAAAADPYFNSSEPGCGTDPNVVMCDDFEDGSWAVTYFDFGANAANNGWLMSVYSPGCGGGGCGSNTPLKVYDAAAPQYARCGKAGAAGTNCTADTGPHAGTGQAYGMGQHLLKGVSTTNDASGYTELYIRWYQKFAPGYTFSGQKGMSFLPPTKDAGIWIGNVSWAGTPSDEVWGAPIWDVGIPYNNPLCRGGRCPSSAYLNQNVGTVFNHGAHLGNWIFTEIRIKLNTPGQRNGVYELWLDDCGAAGTSCPGTPTKRASYNNVMWVGPSNTGDPGSSNFTIGRIFHENWANPGPGASSSLYERNDQYKVSRVGPIGFAGASTVPPPTGPYTLLVTPQGDGTVTGGGSYPVNTVVTPIATANAGATFTGWSGDCTGMTCTLTMTSQKAVTATFTGGTTPPPTTGCAITPTPAAITFAHPPGGPLPPPQSFRVVTSDGSQYRTFDTGFYDAAPCYATSCPSGTMTTITPMPTTLSLAPGTYTYPLDLTAGPNCPKVSVPVVLTIGAPPAPSMGKLTVESQITRCNYFLTAEPPDATGGWVAQFYRDGANKVGNPIPAAPYRRSVELFAPSHSFSVDFTKTGQLMRSPAVVTRVCP